MAEADDGWRIQPKHVVALHIGSAELCLLVDITRSIRVTKIVTVYCENHTKEGNRLLESCYLSRDDHNLKIKAGNKEQMLVNIPS